jgi:hypothetical protein
MKKPRLYLDVDDTIIANCHSGSGFDLRPGVLTQIRVLTKLYDCVWLTMWPRKNIYELIKALYGSYINSRMTYADWDEYHPQRKAGYVLDAKQPQNFWWLEDPLCPEELQALTGANKLDRYIRVEAYGNWAFLDSLNELFRRTGVDANEIKRVGGKPEWFDKEAIMAENPNRENLRETLSMVKLIAGGTTLSPQDTLKHIQAYIDNQLDTLY